VRRSLGTLIVAGILLGGCASQDETAALRTNIDDLRTMVRELSATSAQQQRQIAQLQETNSDFALHASRFERALDASCRVLRASRSWWDDDVQNWIQRGEQGRLGTGLSRIPSLTLAQELHDSIDSPLMPTYSAWGALCVGRR
jgi:outer membrane murein-binding lipoprotein Lpp